jgi:hypothetical protein
MGEFSKDARSQCDVLMGMAQKMDELYSQLADFFVFDKQKYTLEEFMGDMKQFKDQFKVRFNRDLSCLMSQSRTDRNIRGDNIAQVISSIL